MLLAAVAFHTFATTPQGAAIAAMYADPRKPPIVKRINVAGRYATVLTSGGRIEGELVTEAILVERFSFGWQALDMLNEQCRLESHGFASNVSAALMSGMPKPHDDRPCRAQLRDAGSQPDVEAVRRMMLGPLIPYVVVSGECDYMRKYGVPQSDWCKFGIFDATWR